MKHLSIALCIALPTFCSQPAPKQKPPLPLTPPQQLAAEQKIINGKIGQKNSSGTFTIKTREQALLDFAVTTPWKSITVTTRKQIAGAFLDLQERSAEKAGGFLKVLGEKKHEDTKRELETVLADYLKAQAAQAKVEAVGTNSLESELALWKSYSQVPAVVAGAPKITFQLLLDKISKLERTPQISMLQSRIISTKMVYDALWNQFESMYKTAQRDKNSAAALERLGATLQNAPALRSEYLKELNDYNVELERISKK